MFCRNEWASSGGGRSRKKVFIYLERGMLCSKSFYVNMLVLWLHLVLLPPSGQKLIEKLFLL